MSIVLSHNPSTSSPRVAATLAKSGRIALAMLCLALVAILVVAIRVFAFEHFHSDPRLLQTLMQLLGGAFNS